MAEQQQFYLLLGNLMSPDNNVRKQSEVRDEDIVVFVGDKFGEDRNQGGHVSNS